MSKETCNKIINYTNVTTGKKILPFRIELNLSESVLDPASGKNQRFCYDVVGAGKDDCNYADLKHLVFGLCDEIPQNQIRDIAVKINGIKQTVVFGKGGNVELLVPPEYDPSTGCPGLKFAFKLDRCRGKMSLCYELKTPYPVGEIPVCLYGDATVASGLGICGPVCPGGADACMKTGYQTASVCVPVTVTPFARVKDPITSCRGGLKIRPGICACPGVVNGSCSFTMSQEICVAVPVEFGANTQVGDQKVACGVASSETCCACRASEETDGAPQDAPTNDCSCGDA